MREVQNESNQMNTTQVNLPVRGVGFGGYAKLTIMESSNDVLDIEMSQVDAGGNSFSSEVSIGVEDIPALIRGLQVFIVQD